MLLCLEYIFNEVERGLGHGKKMLVRYHIHSFFVITVTDDLNDLN